jgi:hypothetical protein
MDGWLTNPETDIALSVNVHLQVPTPPSKVKCLWHDGDSSILGDELLLLFQVNHSEEHWLFLRLGLSRDFLPPILVLDVVVSRSPMNKIQVSIQLLHWVSSIDCLIQGLLSLTWAKQGLVQTSFHSLLTLDQFSLWASDEKTLVWCCGVHTHSDEFLHVRHYLAVKCTTLLKPHLSLEQYLHDVVVSPHVGSELDDVLQVLSPIHQVVQTPLNHLVEYITLKWSQSLLILSQEGRQMLGDEENTELSYKRPEMGGFIMVMEVLGIWVLE